MANAVPCSAASRSGRQLCKTQLCLSAAEDALSWTRHEGKGELVGNRADCYGNICLFVDVV